MNELEINCKRYNGQLYGKQQLLNQQWCCLRFETHWHSNEIVFLLVRMAYQILTMTGLAFPPISILIMPRVFWSITGLAESPCCDPHGPGTSSCAQFWQSCSMEVLPNITWLLWSIHGLHGRLGWYGTLKKGWWRTPESKIMVTLWYRKAFCTNFIFLEFDNNVIYA